MRFYVLPTQCSGLQQTATCYANKKPKKKREFELAIVEVHMRFMWMFVLLRSSRVDQ